MLLPAPLLMSTPVPALDPVWEFWLDKPLRILLVLLGASIDFSVIVSAAGPAVLQAFVLITVVFGFTWWLAGRPGT